MREVWKGGLVLAVLGLPLSASAAATTIGDLSRVTARAALVVDSSTGQVLFARNPNQRLPPASTTKLVTAILALESGRLDRKVRISKGAAAMPASKLWLGTGWTMSVRDLTYAILLKSANDAAVALAEGLAGSVPNFARFMNQRVQALGAVDSNFVNPNGLPDSRHYSSAADMARIVDVALQTPGMRQILSTKKKTIRPHSGSTKAISLRTTNRLLGNRSFDLIGKTGYTRAAKRCFAGAASSQGRQVIVVVLGSNNLWTDLDLLINFGLQPPPPTQDWSDETGWRQALAPKAQDSAKLQPASPETIQVRPVPQGDTVNDTAEERFIFHVQLASLKSKTLAQDLLKEVSQRGYNVTILPSTSEGKTAYLVLIRDFANRAIARRVARQLGRELNLSPQIIAVRG
jgi:D-alanyl-D-alanine carboxypeptidase